MTGLFSFIIIEFQVPDTAPLPEVLLHQQEKVPLQHRLPTLCMKFYKHWKQIITRAGYSDLTVTVNQFTGMVLSTCYSSNLLRRFSVTLEERE